MTDFLALGVDRIRQDAPLVHNVTNLVAMTLSANVLIAAGASPIMSAAPEEAAALAAEVAGLRGVTKTAAVIDALRKERDALQPTKEHDAAALIARLDEYRREHPLPPPTGLKADKAFFDAMWDEI